MDSNIPFNSYSELVGAIYEAPLDDPPWQQQLAELRLALDAKDVVLILRQPSEADIGVSFITGSAERPAPSSPYFTQRKYTLDPFVNLPPNEPVLLSEVISDEALREHEFYRLVLEPADIFYMLGVDIRNRDGLRANLRITRSYSQPPFDDAAKELCTALLPHIARALRIHDRISGVESERLIYAGAMTQLAVATILLDEQRQVIRSNPLADRLLAEKDGIRLMNGRLRLEHSPHDQRLQDLISDVAAAQDSGKTILTRAMRTNTRSGQSEYNLVVRAIPPGDRPDGVHEPTIAIFISDQNQKPEASAQLLNELFGLTPTEAKLAIMLTSGFTIETASQKLNVSRHTVRAHLRSIFAKTGASGQTMLVRLLLNSVANFG